MSNVITDIYPSGVALSAVYFSNYCHQLKQKSLTPVPTYITDATKDFNRLLRCLFSDCKTIMSSKTFGHFVCWHSPKGLTKMMLSCLICICSNHSEIEK